MHKIVVRTHVNGDGWEDKNVYFDHQSFTLASINYELGEYGLITWDFDLEEPYLAEKFEMKKIQENIKEDFLKSIILKKS